MTNHPKATEFARTILANRANNSLEQINLAECYLDTRQSDANPYCWTWDMWIRGGEYRAEYGWKPYGGQARPQFASNLRPLYLHQQLEGSLLVKVEDIQHLVEYWNGNHNEKAMGDALDHIISNLEAMLSAAPQPGKESGHD